MASEHKVTQRKLTLVGDSCCGKTSLLRAALYGNSPEKVQSTFDLRHNVPFEQCPGIYECNVSNEKGHSIIVRLALWDTAGVYDFGRLEPLKYPGAHVVLISFAIDSPDSMDNVEEKWISEAAHFCPGIPIILVGLKKDLRDDPVTIEELRKNGLKPTPKSFGDALAHKIGAYRYLECSSLTGEGVKDVFETGSADSLLEPKKDKAKRCCAIL
ncbi:uncharacterized protein N7473_001789 [Penicillium subrubescens]|nr:uncharacterized protein N7473_001789 [Penicillium subrubescens]KAJ5904873.1 hypothetical protein N7473_001789 [Penicillium subrubescens]